MFREFGATVSIIAILFGLFVFWNFVIVGCGAVYLLYVIIDTLMDLIRKKQDD